MNNYDYDQKYSFAFDTDKIDFEDKFEKCDCECEEFTAVIPVKIIKKKKVVKCEKPDCRKPEKKPCHCDK